MPLDNDFDDDGNNIVPCPLCGSEYCPSKFDKTKPCPEEENFKKSMPLSNSREVAELKPEGNPNPDCWRCRVGEWPNMHVCEIAPATAKPFTMDGVMGEFDEEMADAFWLHPDDKMGREASSSRVKSFIAQHFKSAFSELMEVVPKNALAEGWEKRGLPNEYDMAWTRGHRAARSALLAKGREMGLVDEK
ncbi:MAG: hypothetical protein M0R06_21260 [Sphaerochaeta sp.]|jgi:hypothetical protein|nr:hypothetical protein [Sphaerochaeta sp.]